VLLRQQFEIIPKWPNCSMIIYKKVYIKLHSTQTKKIP